MNKLTKIGAWMMALLMAASALPITALCSFATTGNTESIPDKVLFASSFESGDPVAAESVSDNGYYSNVEPYEIVTDIDGEFTDQVLLDSVQGSKDYKDEESKVKLFDQAASTKFLTELQPSSTNPVWVSFSLSQPMVLGVYAITSANDEDGRDPKSWTLYGSSDGNTYTALDARSGQKFTGRGQMVTYNVENTVAYQYYKLEITENNGSSMTQLADLRLGTGVAAGGEAPQDSPMTSIVNGGPNSSWNMSGAFDGTRALSVYGSQSASKETYARNLLYSNLNIPVTKNTQLSYVHFPALYNGSTYDYEYTSMHFIIDVKFTDGTYLSDLGAVDQNGFGMDPVSKGESDALFTMQWNYIESCLGDVAEGKTIDSLYVYFRMNSTTAKTKFLAYFDDIVIEDKAPVSYEHLSDYICTTRGTNCTTTFSRGLTTPFCTMPNGFNFYTPVTETGSNQPYHYQNRVITQFSISHVPSTWVGDYGTWQFMANTSVDINNMTSDDLSANNLGASFDHANEIAKAHYYSVTFDEGSKADGVQVEMTPTTHGVYVRFTFPKDSEHVNIVLDCVRASGSLSIQESGVFTASSSHTNNGSATMQVYGQFDQKPESFQKSGTKTGIVTFPAGTTEVTMKLTTSFISQKQAQRNMALEFSETDTFDSIFEKAQKAWDDVCGIIELEGASYTQLVTFYSNMYRLYSYPNLYSENEGTNEEPVWVYASPYTGRKTSGKLYVNNGFWDTYRTTWAAYAFLTPSLDTDLLNGLLQHYNDNGWIPRWVAPGGANSMLGTSSDIIFADAYIKGVQFDYQTAYESMLRNASTVSQDTTNGGRAENETAPFIGYVSNATGSGFSWTVEDYISDYCIGVMSEALGYQDEAAYYYNRAKFYVNMYNEKVGFLMGKNASGSWSYGDDYSASWWWGDYTETNGWTMMFVPVYDGVGLANLLGGKDALAKKLDEYFDNSISSMKKVQTGTIHEMVEAREVRLGQYGHSNQPAHAVPYMYAYAGQPYKTQALTRDVLSRLYVGSEIGQGYCGDEDNGEMSGWYILSSLGLYPQNMGSGQYIITSPLFDKATVHLENGKDLVIIAENNSADNVYIQSATLNGEAYNKCFIDHATLMEGGTLSFKMGDQPSDWSCSETPTSLTTGDAAATPAEDLVTSRYKKVQGEFTPGAANGLYSTIEGISKLADNTSKTYATVSNGDSVIYASSTPSQLSMYTVTCNASKKAPTSLTLEASNDGVTWKLLDSRSELTFNWDTYTRAFAIPEDTAGTYLYYRLTFGGSSMQVAEIEFLGYSAKDAELTPINSVGTPEEPSNSNDPAASNSTDSPSVWLWIGIGAAVLIVAAVCIIVIVKKKKNKING